MTGLSISARLRKRLRYLEDITLMLDYFYEEISFYLVPLSELIRSYGKNKSDDRLLFIDECILLLDEGVDFPVAWETSVKGYCELLKKIERIKLSEYGISIGKTDSAGQKAVLEKYNECFDSYKNQAWNDYNKYSKVTISGFFLIGCALFILFI